VFALIGWIGRVLLILFVARLIFRMIWPSPARTSGGQAPGGPQRGPFGRKPVGERVGGQLVRCATCGTYVPETTAITVSMGGDVLKFCSDQCRQGYTTARFG
jgi:hypothetical protein